jgi:hypothetical protein
MYDDLRKNGAHSREWVDKTNKFIEHAFSLLNTGITRCPGNKCRNGLSHNKKKVSIHIWRKSGAHSREWVDKTNKFIEHAFSLSNTGIAMCPCIKCQNGLSHNKKKVLIHICRFGYMPGYEVWVHHGEEVPENKSVAEDDVTDKDRMDEMLNAICLEFEADFEDPLLRRFKSFLSSLKLQKRQCTITRRCLFFLL